jgi:AraC-like DNA-binding protein
VLTAEPDRALAPIVRRYSDWSDSRTSGLERRRHGPSIDVPLIVDFGGTLASVDRVDGRVLYAPGFVAGLQHRYAVTEANGPSAGIQVDLTPIGAHLLLGVSMHEITDRTIALGDAMGADGDRLVEQLRCARSAEDRFAIVDSMINARIAAARLPARAMFWAWNVLEANGGRVSISDIGDRLGWSRKHVVAQFREHIGLAPKMMARIVRFNRAAQAIRSGERPNFGAIAADAGYYDQAHMVREFIEFSGSTPGKFFARRVPDSNDLRDS